MQLRSHWWHARSATSAHQPGSDAQHTVCKGECLKVRSHGTQTRLEVAGARGRSTPSMTRSSSGVDPGGGAIAPQ